MLSAALVLTPGPAVAAPAPQACPVARPLLVGARGADLPFGRLDALLGPVRVTRLFYPRALPARFTRPTGIGAGVKMVVSYKDPSPDTATYAASVPIDASVELVVHHEPEGPKDFAGPPAVAGARFVRLFDSEAAVIREANPRIRVGFVAGAYQYGGRGHGGSRGLGGAFIPDAADDYYLDSYQRRDLVPAAQDPRVRHYLAELAAKGHPFDGFTEYGRGEDPAGAGRDAAAAGAQGAARARVIAEDQQWLAAQPEVDTWIYWFTGGRGGGWRFTDTASIQAWRAAASTVRPEGCDPIPQPPPPTAPAPPACPPLPTPATSVACPVAAAEWLW